MIMKLERNMLWGGLGEELLAVEGESYFSWGVWPSLVVCPCSSGKAHTNALMISSNWTQ